MPIQRIGSGPRMSQAVIHGGLVYLAGQVADKTTQAGVAEQTKEILDSIDALLRQAGTDKAKILTATIYLSDMAAFPEMNKIWDGWVAQGHAPARATVEAQLAAPHYKIEIVIVAAK